jgi:DNA-binding NtrC family response regulator
MIPLLDFSKSERTIQMQLSKFKNNISGPIIGNFKTEPCNSSARGKTFLLIDDEPMVTDICEMMLKKLGYQVLKANNGKEGIEIFEANKDRIDLIISDFNMPGMNGQEVVDKLRVIDHRVKVLLSSGGLSVPHEEDAIVRGFNGFLQKPYSIDILSDKIDKILN